MVSVISIIRAQPSSYFYLTIQFLCVSLCGFIASPYFAAPSRLVTVKKGDTATLHCEVHGDKPVTVTWLKGGKSELNPSTNYR